MDFTSCLQCIQLQLGCTKHPVCLEQAPVWRRCDAWHAAPLTGSPEPGTPGLPLVDHFEFDALGLDGPAEATVSAVNAQFELLLEFCAGKEEGERLAVWACTQTGLFVCACCVGMLNWRSAASGVSLHCPPCLRQSRIHCRAHPCGPQALSSLPH